MGPGAERLWAGTPIGAHPGGVLPPLPPRAKEVTPQGEISVRRRAESLRPTDVTVHGRRAATGLPPRRLIFSSDSRPFSL